MPLSMGSSATEALLKPAAHRRKEESRVTGHSQVGVDKTQLCFRVTALTHILHDITNIKISLGKDI